MDAKDLTPKAECISQLKEIVEDKEFKMKRSSKRLSPGEKRQQLRIHNFYKSIIHHLENKA